MKKHFSLATSMLIFLVLSCTATSLSALEFLAEAKAGYFYPSNGRFQKIYHDGGGIYGAEVSVGGFDSCCCNSWAENWYGWASANYFERSGRSIGGNDRTTIQMVPVGLGAKYFFPGCFDNMFNFYLGAGGLATWLKLRDHSPFVIPKSEKWGFGGIFKAGAIIDFCGGFFADIFVDYSIVRVKFHNTDNGRVTRQTAHLDGVSGGLGLGYRF